MSDRCVIKKIGGDSNSDELLSEARKIQINLWETLKPVMNEFGIEMVMNCLVMTLANIISYECAADHEDEEAAKKYLQDLIMSLCKSLSKNAQHKFKLHINHIKENRNGNDL